MEFSFDAIENTVYGVSSTLTQAIHILQQFYQLQLDLPEIHHHCFVLHFHFHVFLQPLQAML